MFRSGSLFTDSQYSANGASVIYNRNTVNTGSGEGCKNCGSGVTHTTPETNSRTTNGSSGWQGGNSHSNNNRNDLGIPPSVPDDDDINPIPEDNRFVPPNLPGLDTPLRQELPPSSKINDVLPDVKLSLEELRREDPSITNVEILGVEELTVPTLPTPAASVLPNPKSATLFSTQPIE
jgi:hypothetical protein